MGGLSFVRVMPFLKSTGEDSALGAAVTVRRCPTGRSAFAASTTGLSVLDALTHGGADSVQGTAL